MAAPVLQTKQKRETGRPDGLPRSSASDGRKEKQSNNTCQALHGMNWGGRTRDEAGRDATTTDLGRCRRGRLRGTVSLPRGSRCSTTSRKQMRRAQKTKGIERVVHSFKDGEACSRARDLPCCFDGGELVVFRVRMGIRPRSAKRTRGGSSCCGQPVPGGPWTKNPLDTNGSQTKTGTWRTLCLVKSMPGGDARRRKRESLFLEGL